MKKYTYKLKIRNGTGDNACGSPNLIGLSLYVEDLLMVFGKKDYLIVPAFWRYRIWTFDRSECLQ